MPMEKTSPEPYRFEPERVCHPEDEEMKDDENNERVQGAFLVPVNVVKSCLLRRARVGNQDGEGTKIRAVS